jgi:hypothetical protein
MSAGKGGDAAMLRPLSRVIAGLRRATSRAHRKHVVPALGGYAEYRHAIPLVDPLSDGQLAELNGLLGWRAFTVDRHGRRFGGVAWEGKRDQAQPVPDRRIVLMDERFQLAGKHVLELGCFEGIHTVGLCMLGARVTAVDGRIENVAKTIVRAAFYGYHPQVFTCDVEHLPPDADLQADLLHHVGVLYHLKDPVRHLLRISRYIRGGVMLDTHYAADEEAEQSYEVEGKRYRYKLYRELGHGDVFSGLYEHSKWLSLDTIVNLLGDGGFPQVEVVETRHERNGPRALLFASRAESS